MSEEKTLVVFRVFNDGGDVIALFPEEAATPDGYSCNSYQHVGQHGAADGEGLVSVTRLATPEEIEPLRKELEGAPYHYKLEIRKRITPAMRRKRLASVRD